MSLSDKQWEFLKDFGKLIVYAESLNYKLTGGELYRTECQQSDHVKNGKSFVSHSRHQDRLAVDVYLFVDGEIQWTNNEHWKKLGDYWKSLNSKNVWGGDWKSLKDQYHFQRDV